MLQPLKACWQCAFESLLCVHSHSPFSFWLLKLVEQIDFWNFFTFPVDALNFNKSFVSKSKRATMPNISVDIKSLQLESDLIWLLIYLLYLGHSMATMKSNSRMIVIRERLITYLNTIEKMAYVQAISFLLFDKCM